MQTISTKADEIILRYINKEVYKFNYKIEIQDC